MVLVGLGLSWLVLVGPGLDWSLLVLVLVGLFGLGWSLCWLVFVGLIESWLVLVRYLEIFRAIWSYF